MVPSFVPLAFALALPLSVLPVEWHEIAVNELAAGNSSALRRWTAASYDG